MKCLIVQFLALNVLYHTKTSNGLHISCEKLCEFQHSDQSTMNKTIEKESECCYDDNSFTIPRGPPPKSPSGLHVQFYVTKNTTGNDQMIAFNVSWNDNALSALSNGSKGYRLSIIRERSSIPIMVRLKLSKAMLLKSTPIDSKITISYSRFGLTAYTEIDPGSTYYFQLDALPMPNIDEDKDKHSSIMGSIAVPRCEDNVDIQGTYNCPIKETTTRKRTTSNSSKATIVSGDASPEPPTAIFIIVCLSLLMLVLLVALAILTFKRMQRNSGEKFKGQKLFVVISNQDVHRGSMESQKADQMCCFFRSQGLQVTYTLWNSTELSQKNTIQWVLQHVDESDHVILVHTQYALTQQNELCKETELLLNPAYDPYTIVCKKMEGRFKEADKYSIVYFDCDVTMPRTLFHIKSCYKFPNKTETLCRHLRSPNPRHMGESLRQYLDRKRECEDSATDHDTLSRQSSRSDEGILLPKISNGASIFDRFDSGYDTLNI